MLLSLLILAHGAAPAVNDGPVVLEAAQVVTGTGQTFAPGAVLIQDGRILQVGEDVARPGNAAVVKLDGVLTPGLVDAFSGRGAFNLVEASELASPALRAADGLLRKHDSWAERMRAGVLSVHLVPEVTRSEGITGPAGWGAVVRAGETATVAVSETRQLLGLLRRSNVRDGDGPTSLEGAMAEYGPLLESGVDGLSERGAVVVVDGESAVNAANRMSEAAGFPIHAWIAQGDVGSYGGRITGGLVGMNTMGSGQWNARHLETWKRLHAAGASIAFGTGYADAASLRRSAMAFARATGDPDAAFAAITSKAADLAGYGRGGRLVRGAPADLVLWSAHPLDATARVEAVMLAGETVYHAAHSEK